MAPRQKVAAEKINNKKLGFGVLQEAPAPLPQPPVIQQKTAQKELRTKFDLALLFSEATWNFFERTRNRPVIVERGVDTDSAPALYISLYRWARLANPLMEPRMNAVRKCYSNLTEAEGDVVYVRGRNVDISPATIRTTWSLPTVEIDLDKALTDMHKDKSLVDVFLNELYEDENSDLMWELTKKGTP
ncbi:OLC1v1001532C1 [Oldenlandia corymbosa var. corymbosa]|uniref:OLC1v1001532C1 n=1 Tax=Oldenlandia corymbosa var. corymbosa TaxID=529605 RepID=A0AAV1D675_OLDCO|nr:OLC1v1001532C1 [Oldenlandia corymbosa var. corymbosa]